MTTFGWLIEDHDHEPRHRWLRAIKYSGEMKGKIIWTFDADTALRFSRKEDAINFAWLFPEHCTLALITEHGFDSSVSSATPELEGDNNA